MPDNTVYVGRPSKWGNPFSGPDAVEKYFKIIHDLFLVNSQMREWREGGRTYELLFMIREAFQSQKGVDELRGKDLACWCPLDKPCHADVLLEIANKGE
jgi:hypothetical protein